jgi:hypothetical protein
LFEGFAKDCEANEASGTGKENEVTGHDQSRMT